MRSPGLWRTVCDRHGFATFVDRAAPQLLRWETGHGWTHCSGGSAMVTRNVADYAGEQDLVLVCELERNLRHGLLPREVTGAHMKPVVSSRMCSSEAFGAPHPQRQQVCVGSGTDQPTGAPDLDASDPMVAR